MKSQAMYFFNDRDWNSTHTSTLFLNDCRKSHISLSTNRKKRTLEDYLNGHVVAFHAQHPLMNLGLLLSFDRYTMWNRHGWNKKKFKVGWNFVELGSDFYYYLFWFVFVKWITKNMNFDIYQIIFCLFDNYLFLF